MARYDKGISNFKSDGTAVVEDSEVLGTIYAGVSDEFQHGVYPIARCIKANKNDLSVVIKDNIKIPDEKPKVMVAGQMEGKFESINRVYDINGISPTLNTCGGGDRQPKIIEKEYTIVAMRGRNPENPSCRIAGLPTEQRLEPNTQGICNTLTSVQKDNLVLENINIPVDEVSENMADRGIMKVGQISSDGSQCGTVVSDEGLCPTLSAGTHGYANPHVVTRYRIRKLTPKECFRLMNFPDRDFMAAESINSNTQLYKEAGNSIIRSVLMAVFSQLNLPEVTPWNKLTLEERIKLVDTGFEKIDNIDGQEER